jgi:hypothetical protein
MPDEPLFIQIDPESVDNARETRRGRVYYPMLKAFMETGFPVGQLNRTQVKGRSPQLLYAGLGHHIKAHDLPIKLIQRRGEILLLRLDLNADGSPNPEWKGSLNIEDVDDSEIKVIDAKEVAARLEDEGADVTR